MMYLIGFKITLTTAITATWTTGHSFNIKNGHPNYLPENQSTV